MKSLILLLALLVTGVPVHADPSHDHEKSAAASVKCDCPPDCHCKQPGGTCPVDGPCVDSCECDNEPPTYKTDKDQDVSKYATGLVDKPLTFEQHKTKLELDAQAAQGELTYEYDVSQVGVHSLGYVKPPARTSAEAAAALSEAALSLADEPAEHKEIDFREILGNKRPKILNQQSCGSCVVFSFTANAQWSMALRNVDIPDLSTGHLMNCGGNGGQCSGDYGENVAKRLINLGKLFSLADYPYVPRTGSCKNIGDKEKFGQFLSWKTIPGDFQSIVEAHNRRQPVSVGIAADGKLSSYRSGVYNGFGSMATNHYMLTVGHGCGTSVDANGNCLFNSKRQLVNGNHEATVILAQSWGQWGDNGFITMLFENKSGKRNNNVAGGSENAQVIDTGLPWLPPGPIVFDLISARGSLHVVVDGAKASLAEIKAVLQAAIDSLKGAA